MESPFKMLQWEKSTLWLSGITPRGGRGPLAEGRRARAFRPFQAGALNPGESIARGGRGKGGRRFKGSRTVKGDTRKYQQA